MISYDYYLEREGERHFAESRDGSAYISTFPFWIFVRRGEVLLPLDLVMDGVRIRVYPPFRSAPANHLPLPPVSPPAIPFPPGLSVGISPDFEIPQVSVIPDPTTRNRVVHWGTRFSDDMEGLPMDALRLDVIGATQNVRNEVQRRLLGLIRTWTKQWWIGRSLEGLVGTTRAAFGIREDGAALTVPMACASVTELLGGEKCLDAASWTDIGAALAAGESASFAADLLMDARLHAAREETRRAILDAAIACEEQTVGTMRWLVERDGGRFRRGRVLRGNGLPDYISSDLLRVTRHHSYQTAHEPGFEQIKRLWDARGNVAHGATPEYRTAGQRIPVTAENLPPLIVAAAHLVAWLAELRAKR